MIDTLDGRDVTRSLTLDAHVVIVGSGPAGSAAAWVCAQAGASVWIVEEGAPYPADASTPHAWEAMALAYRDSGAQLSRGRPPLPIVQGRCVGGGSVINGAIHWPLPSDVLQRWHEEDPGLATSWSSEDLDAMTQLFFRRLRVGPTPRSVQGRNSLLMRDGADALGLENRPTLRNAPGCQATGRCLQGCPSGAKQRVDHTLLADAAQAGARLICRTRAVRVVHNHQRCAGVHAVSEGGATVRLRARRAVLLAASAVQSPALLLRSRLSAGPVGRHFQAHPGVGVLGRFSEEVVAWTGATQGWEVIGLRQQGLKFEALGLDPGVLASRLPGLGKTWAHEVDRSAQYASWGAALKATSEGRIRLSRGQPVVHYTLSPEDRRGLARGVAWLGRMMFAAGAQEVLPGVQGLPERVTTTEELDQLEANPPSGPEAYTAVVTHMFGTCRAHSHPGRGVVRPDLRHHQVDGLYVVDSSVFPTNTGVNPQGSILAIAGLGAHRVMAPTTSPREAYRA